MTNRSSTPSSQPYSHQCSRRFFATDPVSLARKLLGCVLVRHLDTGERLAGMIVETEAYLGIIDKASHTFGSRHTARNESMWAKAGTAYVYFTYGMHHCMNISAGSKGDPVAVLIRALEPLEGLETMRRLRLAGGGGGSGGRRKTALPDRELCAGPARLCQALAIDRALDGLDMAVPGAVLCVEQRKTGCLADEDIAVGPRVGIRSAAEWADKPLRFAVTKNLHTSRPRL